MGGLSVRERRVLFGLVRWPGLSDVGLGEELSLGRSTVTVVRRRLERGGFVSGFLLPDFGRVGCELLTALYGEFSGAGGVGSLGRELRDGLSSVFYMVRSGGLHLSLGAAGSLTDVAEGIRSHHRIHHEGGFLSDRRHNYVFFPLKFTRVLRFFDYAPLLASHFGLDYVADKVGFKKPADWSPSSRELKVFRSLVSFPNETDEKVASVAGVSRQTVNGLRNRFLEGGLLRPVRVPDLSKIGFGLMAFSHLHMNPHHGVSAVEPRVREVLSDPAHVLNVSGDLESVALSFYRDYGEFRSSQARMVDSYKRGNLLLGDPVTQVFPLDQTEHVVYHDYGGIVAGLKC